MKYYLFSFLNYFGDDRVFVLETKQKFWTWDLIKKDWEYFLNLGEKISWQQKYDKKIEKDDFEIYIKWFLSKNTLEIVHFMVYQYFSTYKKILNLFMDLEIWNLLRYRIEKTKKTSYKEAIIDYPKSKLEFTDKKKDWQILIVFSDLLTLKNYCELELDILHGSSTQAIKNKIFWKIKSWDTWIFLCTYSQIFKDYQNLKEIIMIDSHKRYYKSQQDPRYLTNTVLEKMSEIYWARLSSYGFMM